MPFRVDRGPGPRKGRPDVPSSSRVALWGLFIGGLLGLAAFYVIGGLRTVVMASFGSWGPSSRPRGLDVLLIGAYGGVVLGTDLALRRWYLSAPLVVATAYAGFRLLRLRRSGRLGPPPG